MCVYVWVHSSTHKKSLWVCKCLASEHDSEIRGRHSSLTGNLLLYLGHIPRWVDFDHNRPPLEIFHVHFKALTVHSRSHLALCNSSSPVLIYQSSSQSSLHLKLAWGFLLQANSAELGVLIQRIKNFLGSKVRNIKNLLITDPGLVSSQEPSVCVCIYESVCEGARETAD